MRFAGAGLGPLAVRCMRIVRRSDLSAARRVSTFRRPTREERERARELADLIRELTGADPRRWQPETEREH